MKSRLILSLLILVAVIGTTGFGAFAFFSFSDSQNFAITSATATLQQSPCVPDVNANLTFVYPGMPQERQCEVLTNDGNAPLYVDFKLSGLDNNLANALYLEIISDTQHWGPAPFTSAAYTSGNGVSLGYLAVGASMTVNFYYTFPDNGDQNSLQSATLNGTGTIAGFTNNQ